MLAGVEIEFEIEKGGIEHRAGDSLMQEPAIMRLLFA